VCDELFVETEQWIFTHGTPDGPLLFDADEGSCGSPAKPDIGWAE
jgi:hypothetical protein